MESTSAAIDKDICSYCKDLPKIVSILLILYLKTQENKKFIFKRRNCMLI